MLKALRPVSVAGIEFDALISSEHKLEATVPEYATDNGYSVSDNIQLKQETLSMVLYLTDTPVTWYKKHGNRYGRVDEVCSRLEKLYYKRALIQVITSDKTYSNMVIESITISKSVENGYAREIPISLRKIRQTKTNTAFIPSYYGKSGPSKSSSGTANTSAGSSASTDTSSSVDTSSYDFGSSSSSSNSSSGSSGSKSSIMYSLGNSLGIIK